MKSVWEHSRQGSLSFCYCTRIPCLLFRVRVQSPFAHPPKKLTPSKTNMEHKKKGAFPKNRGILKLVVWRFQTPAKNTSKPLGPMILRVGRLFFPFPLKGDTLRFPTVRWTGGVQPPNSPPKNPQWRILNQAAASNL